MKWKTEASCLDSAYERMAITQGLNVTPVFKENQVSEQQFQTEVMDEQKMQDFGWNLEPESSTIQDALKNAYAKGYIDAVKDIRKAQDESSKQS